MSSARSSSSVHSMNLEEPNGGGRRALPAPSTREHRHSLLRLQLIRSDQNVYHLRRARGNDSSSLPVAPAKGTPGRKPPGRKLHRAGQRRPDPSVTAERPSRHGHGTSPERRGQRLRAAPGGCLRPGPGRDGGAPPWPAQPRPGTQRRQR